MKRLAFLAAAALLAASAGSGHAMTVRGAAGAPPPATGASSPRTVALARTAATTPRASTPANALTLIPGQVTAVDRTRRLLTISGRQVEWHAAKMQVFSGQGRRASLAQLQPGTRVRFALEPGTGEGRKIVLVYVDAAP